MHILLIEDDKKISAAIAKHLKAEGYAVDIAADGLTGEELAKVNDNDVIILDLMLPRQDGWKTCSHIRSAGVLTPILMLTALDSIDHRIAGLDLGADDYLPKPFHIGELLARIRSLARRRSEVRSAVIERFGIRLDLSARRAWRDENEIPLTAKEFALLELLMMNPDKVLTRETISERLWDTNFEPKSNVIESFVKFLRQKIDRGYNARLIHTVRGAGYRFSDHE
jgi:DNA-binding response OmpR family regulator